MGSGLAGFFPPFHVLKNSSAYPKISMSSQETWLALNCPSNEIVRFRDYRVTVGNKNRATGKDVEEVKEEVWGNKRGRR